MDMFMRLVQDDCNSLWLFIDFLRNTKNHFNINYSFNYLNVNLFRLAETFFQHLFQPYQLECLKILMLVSRNKFLIAWWGFTFVFYWKWRNIWIIYTCKDPPLDSKVFLTLIIALVSFISYLTFIAVVLH